MSVRSVLLVAALALALGLLGNWPVSGYTRLDLTETVTGRRLLAGRPCAGLILRDGEQVTLRWTNSLFDLPVREVFVADSGRLVLDMVTFEETTGRPATEVAPRDVEDLYHTGGAFAAHGMNRSFTQVSFRVSEIGHPQLQVRDQMVDFKQEVGFGGGVRLAVRPARLYERLIWAVWPGQPSLLSICPSAAPHPDAAPGAMTRWSPAA